MATPVPPLSTPAASRTRDWVRTAEPGSAFSGLGRGGRGGGNNGGRGRRGGGRSRGGPGGAGAGGGASTSRAPSTANRPAASGGSTAKPAAISSTSAAPAEKPSAPPAAPARSQAPGRKSSRSAVPTVVVGPASLSAAVPATTPRPSNRRRRSQLTKGSNTTPAAGLKVNVLPSDDNLLRPQNRQIPHSAPPPSKDTPPHLAGAFDMRNNIDALVERVRAVAMDNRPSTPGSHIDWAGDDDEGLPDLDDWGVTTGTSVGDKDEMISPIIVDGLKPLPEPVAKPPTPSGDRKEAVIVPFVMKDQQNPPTTAQPSLHPSLPHKPVSETVKEPLAPTAGTTPASQPPVYSVDGTPDVEPGEKQDLDDEAVWDAGREGLAASIHAPTLVDSLSAASDPSAPPHPRNFNPTHNRAQTVGRAFPQSAPVNFNSRFPRSGSSTPRGGYPSGGQHARTHSSPPAGSVLSNNHRPPHARPVITGDAISRLARTIARTPQIPASNI